MTPGVLARIRSDRVLQLLLVLGLALRLGAALWSWNAPIVDDGRAYDAVARNLVAGKGFSTDRPVGLVNPGRGAPTSLWGCLQPLWVAAFYALFGPLAGPVYLANAVIGLIPVLCAAELGARLSGRPGARIAAGFIALDPYLVKLGATLMSEPLYIALLWPALLLALRWAEEGGARAAAGAGALLALAALSRALAFYLAVLLAAWILLERRSARGLAAFTAALALVLAPWVVRNVRVHDPPVFLDTKAGWNLYSFLHPAFEAAEETQPPVPPEFLRPEVPESRRNQLLLEQARGFLRADPWSALRQVPAKAWQMWSPFPGRRTEAGSAPIKLTFVLTLELGALLGMWRAGAGLRPARLLYVVLGYHLLVHALMMGGPRFRAPLDPALAVLAGIGPPARKSSETGISA